MNPARALFNLTQRDEQALVASPRRARWLRWRLLVNFAVLLLGALWVSAHLHGPPLPSLLIGVGMGLSCARAAGATHARALAYRTGWLAGRQAMVAALAEAQRRDMTPRDWLQAQLEADLALLGATAPPLPEGDE